MKERPLLPDKPPKGPMRVCSVHGCTYLGRKCIFCLQDDTDKWFEKEEKKR